MAEFQRTLTRPFTPEEIADLRQKLKDADELIRGIDTAIRAGVPLTNDRANAVEARNRIQSLLNTYGGI